MVDHVKANKEGFTLAQLTQIMGAIDAQPQWRGPASIACAYYDGDQLSSQIRQVLQERGQPEIVHNMIGPTIDGVLGMEAKTRADLLVSADDEEGEELAQALNEKFKDAWRLANADRACSDAYAGQLKAGIGWVEVSRNPIPFEAAYRVKFVHRRNIWWDWHAQEIDRSDSRWKIYKKWVDFDEALATFPDHKEVLQQSINLWEGFGNFDDFEEDSPDLHAAWHDFDSWDRKQSEWMDQDRQRILLQVVMYKVWQRSHVIKLSDGRVIEYDPKNQVHVAALQSGKVKLSYAAFPKVREAWFVGPHRIVDRPCSAPDGKDSLIPFIGYQKDSSGEPYGLVSRMIPAQDGINARIIRLNFLLQARRIIADEDATNLSARKLKEEVEKPDGYIPLNPDRKNKHSITDSFNVQNDIGIAAQQFSLMQNDMKLIQDCAGVYNSMLGQDSNATSGVAIANLVEQGTTTLAEVNDNFHYSRNKVAGLLLDYIIEDMMDRDNVSVTINRQDKARRKTIVVNGVDDDNQRSNDVARFRGHIALMPVQATPTYRQQQANQLTQAMSKLPPEAQALVVPMLIELMDLPNKQDFLSTIRQALNIPKAPEDMSPEEQEAAAQEQQKAQQMEAMQMAEIQGRLEKVQLERGLLEARIGELAKKTETEAVKDDKIVAETEQIIQEIDRSNAEVAAMRSTLTQNIQSQLDAIEV
ncbi:portal protein [Shewanella hanedai]|uniref:Portal protein n=1 Tax=Shewanella hanedai TaxID=25 RepID=A0A553JMZ7_SHEHA|nr:portal protein [Shewanella hanedai]TRY13835.1 portal protein [Shewanella hanedai]GGI85717.1 portal protein [Shewanella hanedai]